MVLTRGIKPDGSPIKVMAVDDSPVTRKMLKKALEPEGFIIVAEAGNGRDAVAAYAQANPDVITMDVTMPIMDGLEAAAAIKKLNPSQKIIMLSAMGDKDIVAEAQSLGITDFCTKPFKPDEIIGKILKVLAEG
ncbi:response regulator [Syntrophothermus lipocalidus]|uniref:Stage 0 sporulation protein A homolog n=1 Tax=Syntrophothermus lipocalidus (strain DSM 12680 / TGB-C1) TaxID=643648 RepID=D7CP57_SYNLT|nr:response regulator [Syntrophothermus lipocalidus]ADI02492.1 response regulator receiver protein [Syntrophothermus lipocalidus DSM 12680]HOV43008.1 response regulator [Syntrophothermus lipocalidus]